MRREDVKLVRERHYPVVWQRRRPARRAKLAELPAMVGDPNTGLRELYRLQYPYHAQSVAGQCLTPAPEM